MDRKQWIAGTALVASLPLTVIFWRSLTRPSHPPLPPGPKPDPIIGNARNFPTNRWYETFCEWQKYYGDIIHVNVLGSHIVVLNSLDAARDLLVKRGNLYSGRPMDMMNNVVMGWDWNVVMAQPGQFHNECRTIFRRGIGQQEMEQHDGVIQEECRNMLKALHEFQGDPWEVIYGAIGAIIIRITYGDSIYRERGQELTDLNRETLDLVTRVSTQFWLVNFLPFLHSLPDWLPLPFKKTGLYGLELQKRMHYWPWEQVVKHAEAGIAEPSISLEYIQKKESLEVARDALGMMYAGGVDNTASTLMSFIGVMLHNPKIQEKVQEELDRELGYGDLPVYNDRPRLPYTEAAWRESVRMNPSTALGVPHMAAEDDVYKDMFIPAGTIIWTNIGFMCRDPRIWDEPDVFKPERWLPAYNPDSASLPDVDDIVFGFGRRVCAGQFLADRIDFQFAAALLKMYDIVPIPGETIQEEFLIKDAIIRRPENLRCHFRPRAHN